MACSSTKGFQKGSRTTTRDAAVRFRPREPALREQRRMRMFGLVRRDSREASRASLRMEPS